MRVEISELQVQMRDGAIELTWRLCNRGDGAVYVTDRVTRVEVGGKVQALHEPRARRGEDGEVVLLCALPPLGGRLFVAPPSALAWHLAAHAEATGRMEVTTEPWATSPTDSRCATDAGTITLELGVVPDDPRLDARALPLDGAPTWRLNSTAWSLQQIVRASVRGAAIGVLQHGLG